MSYTYAGHTHKKVKVLILSESLITVLSASLAILISSFNYPLEGEIGDDVNITNVLVFTLVSQLSSLSVGLYELRLRETIRGVVRRLLVGVALTYFFMAVAIYSVFVDLVINPLFLPIAALTSFFLLSLFRVLTYGNELIGISRKEIIVIGAGERASIIEKRMRRQSDRRGVNIRGFVPMSGDKYRGIDRETIINVSIEEKLKDYVIKNNVEEVVIACDERRDALPLEALFDFKIRGVEITDILDFIERETGQVAVNLIYPSWVIYSNGFRTTNHLRESVDYIFNAFLASIVLFFFWPVMLITALFIYLEDGRKTKTSVFYKQERVGEDGRLFSIIKFRSMRPDAEKAGAQFAQKNDNRVTRIGGFIRKYRIDELPQLINVFRGEMGFVGPRPERPEFVKEFVKKIPYYNQRHNVKPGLTGWAQLKYPYGSSDDDTVEKLKFDLYYIKHRSILFDLLILMRTIEVVLFGQGR